MYWNGVYLVLFFDCFVALSINTHIKQNINIISVLYILILCALAGLYYLCSGKKIFCFHIVDKSNIDTIMNDLTKKFLKLTNAGKVFYSEHAELLDSRKCFTHLLPLMEQMLQVCRADFERSVAYVETFRAEQERKRAEIEKQYFELRNNLMAYAMDHDSPLSDDLKLFLQKPVNDLDNRDMLRHLQILGEMLLPVKGVIMRYGFTQAAFRDLTGRVQDLIVAIPMDVSEIEARQEQLQSALKAMNEIRYCAEHF